MLYYLFNNLGLGGESLARLSSYITVRSSVAFVLSLLCATIIGRHIINRLQLAQMGEIVRNLGLEGQTAKQGTPTMGGIIIIIAIVLPLLLIADLSNVYMLIMLISTLGLGALGFADDYLKIRRHNKDGMAGKYKIVGQIGIGLFVGLMMTFHPDITMRDTSSLVEQTSPDSIEQVVSEGHDIKVAQTTIPFVKNNNLDYSWFTKWAGNSATTLGWVLFVLVVIFAVTATSNGANLTDGIDGLATGVSAIIGVALIIMAYLGSNIIYSTYLNIMYIPGSEEMVVFMAAFIGALIGFLWYNAFPAQVFMGDTGSLTLGGIIAVFAILIRKELLIPLLCAVFFVEDISVMLQTGWFKFTKKRSGGNGQRIFKMAPLHHHFQKDAQPGANVLWNKPVNGVHEAKITIRFWIVSIILAALTFVTLKIR
ncbi:MAG: phospho-N-acetylmuramoyl-pentapeptide-transferase [Bacteroides sp.]|nr:phospho-N-acetylmuramoyl-pentapeptide-transferase [Bacteroides sp.]MCM1379210.1 phospho-N-acetylmuramoyl-pentapeptide-transferase [Bacteroides sp.]MCM1445141.1 phospho-N-acetylmuramoyl-pentapeptide-transferase [Prevotella sp.]